MTPYARHIARLEEVPPELRDLPIWCAWELVRNPKKAKPDKVPVSPITGMGGALLCISLGGDSHD